MGRKEQILIGIGGIAIGFCASALMRSPVARGGTDKDGGPVESPFYFVKEGNTTVDEHDGLETYANAYTWQSGRAGEVWVNFYFTRPDPRQQQPMANGPLVAKLKARIVMTQPMAEAFGKEMGKMSGALEEFSARRQKGEK